MGHDHNQIYIFMRKYITPMGVFRKIRFSNGACQRKGYKYNILKVLLLMGTHHYLGSYFYTEWKYYPLMGHDPFLGHFYEVKSSFFWQLIHKYELKLKLYVYHSPMGTHPYAHEDGCLLCKLQTHNKIHNSQKRPPKEPLKF